MKKKYATPKYYLVRGDENVKKNFHKMAIICKQKFMTSPNKYLFSTEKTGSKVDKLFYLYDWKQSRPSMMS